MVRFVCIGLHQCILWLQRERAYTYGVCVRALSCNVILKCFFTHVTGVCVCTSYKEEKPHKQR
jgi:hypothetical protein